MDQPHHSKRRERVSDFADQYSLFGKEKYPTSKMPKKSKFSSSTVSHSKKSTKEQGMKEVEIDCTELDMVEPEDMVELDKPDNSCSYQTGIHHSEWEVDRCYSDSLGAYKALIYEHDAYASLNTKLTVFAILDYDFSHNILKKSKPYIVFRQGEHFLCSCDNPRRVYFENVGNCSAEEARKYHKPCFHSTIIMEIYQMFTCSNNLESDHVYSSEERDDENENGIREISFMEDVFSVYDTGKMTYGLVKVSFGHMKCLTCPENCSHSQKLEDILKKYEKMENSDIWDIVDYINARLCKNSNVTSELQCYSGKKISFVLPEHLRAKIQETPENIFIKESGKLKVVDMNAISCPNCDGCLQDEKVLRQNILFLSKYKMVEVECYNRVCINNKCGYIEKYDGQDDCVLNMGKFLVHYEVLRNYMHLFLYSGCTMYAFYNTWKAQQADVGNHSFPEKFPYSCFRWSWYSYLHLLDIDTKQTFYCDEPGCGMHPSTLLFDGTTLSFQRSFMRHLDIPNEEQSTAVKVKGSHKERIFILDMETRSIMKEYTKSTGIDDQGFFALKERLRIHQPALLQLFEHLEETGCTATCPEELRGLVNALSCSSAVCATFRLPDKELLKKLLDEELSSERKYELQSKIPVLFDLLSPLERIPNYLRPILKEIVVIVERTFAKPINTTMKIGNSDGSSNNLSFYPNLPRIRKRGIYTMDKLQGETICSKKSTRHSSLLPGIFTVFCPHGICYGFEVMECAESPNRPFSLLKSRFEEPPAVIIYDNSCNLHNYCLNRDPSYFANTLFVVDRLHWDNHTACSPGYRAHSYPSLRTINTQVVEQNNSKLKKLKSSLSYMNPENFMNILKFFLWFCNQEMKKKMSK